MPRILLVEDNEMNRDMLSRRLRRRGYEVSIATDGLNGLDSARELLPDLILMDLSLPGIDGWEATRRLKDDPITQPIPIIALTAHAMAGDRERAFEAGVDDYDIKPIDFVRLLTKIEAILADLSPTPASGNVPIAGNDVPSTPGQLRHDLIGPLVRIIGYCELLGEDAEAVGRTHRSQSLHAIRTLAHETCRSIDAILLHQADPDRPVDLDSLAPTLLPRAHTMIQACEALRDASAHVPDREAFLVDLERIQKDATLLVSMVWAASGARA